MSYSWNDAKRSMIAQTVGFVFGKALTSAYAFAENKIQEHQENRKKQDLENRSAFELQVMLETTLIEKHVVDKKLLISPNSKSLKAQKATLVQDEKRLALHIAHRLGLPTQGDIDSKEMLKAVAAEAKKQITPAATRKLEALTKQETEIAQIVPPVPPITAPSAAAPSSSDTKAADLSATNTCLPMIPFLFQGRI